MRPEPLFSPLLTHPGARTVSVTSADVESHIVLTPFRSFAHCLCTLFARSWPHYSGGPAGRRTRTEPVLISY